MSEVIALLQVQVVKVKVRSLVDNFSHIRQVRGDGNCFYRAIGYGYLELVILHGRDAIQDLILLYLRRHIG